MRLKERLHERPYLSAIAAGALWNAVGASEDIKALMTSALVVGLCVGLLGKAGWRSLLTKVPASLGCFALVALCADITGRVLGRREANMYSVMNMVMMVYSSPLVIVGVLLGSVAKAYTTKMRPLLMLLALATVLPMFSGCAPLGAPPTVSVETDPSSLVFAVPEGKRGGDPRRDNTAATIGKLSGLQTISMFNENDPGEADVIVRLKPGAFAWEITTISVRGRRVLTTGSASPFSFSKDIANHLKTQFGPETGLYKRLMSAKQAEMAAEQPVASAPAAPAAPAFRSDVEAPSFRLPEDDTKFALVVGVEDYQTVAKAEHAARDARAVKAHLEAAGYPERNIIFLVDQQAGKSALEKYLEAWLPRNTDERSTVLFYFSGHGAPDPEKGQAYLMPWDADAKFTETTGYPVKRLYAKLNALTAKRVIVAMDACFSGAGPRSVIGKGLRPLVAKIDDGGGSVGRIGALTASASDEMTGSDDASGHGLFTYHLLKALNARAGRATLKELFDALSPKVRDAARRDNRDQTPQLVGDGRSTL